MNDRQVFSYFVGEGTQELIDGKKFTSYGYGDVLVEYGNCDQILLQNTLYVPDAIYSLCLMEKRRTNV